MWRHTNVGVTGHARSSSSLGCSTQRPVSASRTSNSFAAPGATGCGLAGLIDLAINAKVGLPSPAGNNNLVLNNGASSVIVEANQGLVHYVAQRYLGMGMAHADIVQEGNLGLLRAIEKFDHRRGGRFGRR